jgi:hypothetical protein
MKFAVEENRFKQIYDGHLAIVLVHANVVVELSRSCSRAGCTTKKTAPNSKAWGCSLFNNQAIRQP